MKKIILVLATMLVFIPPYGMVSLAQTPTPADTFELKVGIENPLGDKKELKDVLAAVLNTIVDIVLPIVIVMVIYSGFLYVMARGKPEAISKAHKTLTWTLIGAAILLGAQLIATVLIDTVSNISNDSGFTERR